MCEVMSSHVPLGIVRSANNNTVKANVENPRGSVEKLSSKEIVNGFAAKGLPKENPQGALTLPLSTVWAPEGLS